MLCIDGDLYVFVPPSNVRTRLPVLWWTVLWHSGEFGAFFPLVKDMKDMFR